MIAEQLKPVLITMGNKRLEEIKCFYILALFSKYFNVFVDDSKIEQ